MNSSFDLIFVEKIWSAAREYFWHQVFTWAMAVQIAVVVLILLCAHRIRHNVLSWLSRLEAQSPKFQESLNLAHFFNVIGPLLAIIFIWIASRTARHFGWPHEGLHAALFITIALFLIRSFYPQMTNRFWAGVLRVYIWLWALFYVFHFMDPWINYLSHIDFQFGQMKVSLLVIYRALFLSFILYWLSRHLSQLCRFWLRAASGLTPAVQVLLYRLGNIFLFSASGVLVLHYLGLDLTVFALFSGALGLGLGFGLQKVFANLISGFILLADKSIKPGDVIELKNTYGRINFLGSRYVSVLTRSGTEHLIPNESLVTGEVINWSHSQDLIRLQVPVGIAYGSDLEIAKELMLEAAANANRVLKEPKPACLLASFGDNAINLELRVWIDDPQNGIGAVKSDLLWGIWRRFGEHGIDLPYPQRDLHLKSMPEIRIQNKDEEK